MRARWRAVVAASVLVAGCGGGGGENPGGADGGAPSASTPVRSLTDEQRGAFCEELAAIEGGYSKPKQLDCDGGTSTVTFTIGATQAECKLVLGALPASCASLTVGAMRSCVTDTYAATCDTPDLPASCDPFFTCVLGGT
jgi:hypothetical protein